MHSKRTLAIAAATAMMLLAVAAITLLLLDSNEQSGGEPQHALCGPDPTGVVSAESLRRFAIFKEFETLPEVEAAAGFEPPEVSAPGWSFQGAKGSPPFGATTLPGSQLGGVDLYYVCDETVLQLTVVPDEILDPLLPTVPVEIDGREVMRLQRPGNVTIQWREDGRGYVATAVPGEGFSEADIYEVIGSLWE